MPNLRPERVLELVRTADGPELHAGLVAFTRFLLLQLSFEATLAVVIRDAGLMFLVWAVLFGACFLASWREAWLRAAAVAALAVAVWQFVLTFPEHANHQFLELTCVAFVAFVGTSGQDERQVLARTLRWLPVLVMLWSGLNKAIYGTYFNGAFLASVLQERNFVFVFGWLLPEAELRTLLATPAAGPWAFRSLPALLVSNLVWLGEIASGIALLVPRLRRLGMALAVLLIVGIEAGAHEIAFGVLMFNLLALFEGGRWSRGVFGASAAFYGVLLVLRLTVLPGLELN